MLVTIGSLTSNSYMEDGATPIATRFKMQYISTILLLMSLPIVMIVDHMLTLLQLAFVPMSETIHKKVVKFKRYSFFHVSFLTGIRSSP